MILVNVLFIVALSASVVLLMVAAQTTAVDRTVRLRQAAQAGAFARAGELSAVVVLRRDAIDAPYTDNLTEPWAAIQDRNVAIEGGRFSLAIIDDQARFNLNTLATGGIVAEDRLARILTALGLQPGLRALISNAVNLGGLTDIAQLSAVGLSAADIRSLNDLTTVLPKDTTINLNTADERLLGIVFASPVTGRLVASARKSRGGLLTAEDLKSLNAILPPGVAFTSNFYRVETDVTVGETRQRVVSALMRRTGPSGPEVVAYARYRTAAEPAEAPPRF